MNTATFISATDTADQVAIFGALEDELTSRRPTIAEKFDAIYDEGLRGASLLQALAAAAINTIAK